MGRGRVKVRIYFPHNFKITHVVLALLMSITVGISRANIWEAHAQPGNFGNDGLAASGRETANRLKAEMAGKNEFRVDKDTGQGGVREEGAVLANMQTLLKKIMVDPMAPQIASPKSELDAWFNPHLRDAEIDRGMANQEATAPYVGRMWAGTTSWTLFGCDGACPGCRWHDPSHWTPACCGVSTYAYADKVLPTNFKACCVREGFQGCTMEEIACTFPGGDGWSGLFEYYFPTNVIGWEAQRATTMIASDRDVKRCLDDSNAAMENSKWVADAIQKGVQRSDGSIEAKVADSIQAVRPKDQSLRFSDTLQGGGLTMRVNFAHMDPAQRVALARQFCMHDLQFMKLMDPLYDKLQMPGTGGSTLSALQNTATIPIWGNYCPAAIKLLTNVNETRLIANVDRTPTNFIQGMMAWDADPLYCQKMNVAANPKGGEFLLNGVLSKTGTSLMTEQGVGYTCRTGDPKKGGFSTRMVPVELHSTAQIDQRTLDHAIPFMIAAGYYPGRLFNGIHSVYKRFEPRPYSQNYPEGLKIFTGKKWKGAGPNERGDICRSYSGKDLQGKNVSDQMYLSDVNHQPFSQEKIMEQEGSAAAQGFNRYDREWADKKPENFHNRNVNKSVLNYGAAFRMFATCPAGYVRWRGDHSEKFDKICGEENFGGIGPPVDTADRTTCAVRRGGGL